MAEGEGSTWDSLYSLACTLLKIARIPNSDRHDLASRLSEEALTKSSSRAWLRRTAPRSCVT